MLHSDVKGAFNRDIFLAARDACGTDCNQPSRAPNFWQCKTLRYNSKVAYNRNDLHATVGALVFQWLLLFVAHSTVCFSEGVILP